MVSRKAKNQAVQYVCDRLEESGLYVIKTKDHESIQLNCDPNEWQDPYNIEVFFANFSGTIKDMRRRMLTNDRNRTYNAPILYKDGKTAFVRMVETNASWRSNKSLKNYTPKQINEMIRLRDKEKELIRILGIELPYYQPETVKLDESITTFRMYTVTYDRTHLKPGDQGYEFAKLHEDSKVDKLPEKIDTLTKAVELNLSRRRGLLIGTFKECENPVVSREDDYLPSQETTSIDGIFDNPAVGQKSDKNGQLILF